MEALKCSASSSTSFKLFSEKYCEDKGLFCLRDSPLDIPAKEICFLSPPTVLHKHLTNLSASLAKPLHKKRPIVPFSSLSSSDAQAETQDKETETCDIINQSKTVHVRFQLQRECLFGQQFHVVGDDPLLGQWDPSGAVPLNWSDGHVWTTELDIPMGRCIKFKIILKEGPKNIIWQPGPDRILQISETQNTITVCEDWDSAELQKILEESTLNQIEESISNAEEITISKKGVQIDKGNTIPGRRLVSNAKESPAAISDEDMNMLMLGGNGSMMSLEDSKLNTDETLLTNRLPLLVPGLNPLPKIQPEEKSIKEVEKHIFSDASSIEADKFELNMPELKLEEVSDNNYQEQHQPAQIQKPQFAEDEDHQNSKSVDLVVQNDIQWGLRTLQKLLAKFRFW